MLAAGLLTALVMTGCATTTSGTATPGKTRPPLRIAGLEEYLLPRLETNQAMGVVGMTEDGPVYTKPFTAGGGMEPTCVGVASLAYEQAYDGSGYTGVRIKVLHEPVGDFADYLGQAVVLFPTRTDARAFYDTSAKSWPACANRRYSYQGPGEAAPTVWTVGPVTDAGGTLSVDKTQEGGNGWACQRALSVANNVVVDVMACKYSQLGGTARAVADQIRSRIDPI